MQSDFKNIGQRALSSGAAAGVASALAAAYGAVRSGHGPFAAINAVTHCIWPERSFRQESMSVRYTGVGSGIHLGSAVFWGVLFEALCGTRPTPKAVIGAAATTAVVAYVVDYHVVPKRVTPGYDVHMTKGALGLTYVALAIGFAAVAIARKAR
jgi:hypothetical protein